VSWFPQTGAERRCRALASSDSSFRVSDCGTRTGPAVISGAAASARRSRNLPVLFDDDAELFAESGCAENTCHQRFCRARADVRDLLRVIVNRDDLFP
jgi:hypothetical protein